MTIHNRNYVKFKTGDSEMSEIDHKAPLYLSDGNFMSFELFNVTVFRKINLQSILTKLFTVQ